MYLRTLSGQRQMSIWLGVGAFVSATFMFLVVMLVDA